MMPHKTPEEIDSLIPRILNDDERAEIEWATAHPDPDESDPAPSTSQLEHLQLSDAWRRVPTERLVALAGDADDNLRNRAQAEMARRRNKQRASVRQTLGDRVEWVADMVIPDEDPPMALPPIMLDEGGSILLGMGESHKSIIGQIAATTLATGVEIIPGWQPTLTGPVMWLDYENSRRRFASRQRLLGHPEAEILYVPCMRPIWDDVDDLANIANLEGIVAVVVDSIVPAISGSALSSKDAEAAGKYFGALNAIAPRSLSLAHVTKDGEGGMPYGSVFFHNLARLTWRARVDDQGRVTLTNEKHTDGDRLPPMTLAFDWDDVLTVSHTTSQLTPVILAGIVAAVGTVTARGMADAVRAAGYPVGRSWLALLAGRAVDEGHLTRPSRGRYEARTTTQPPLMGRVD